MKKNKLINYFLFLFEQNDNLYSTTKVASTIFHEVGKTTKTTKTAPSTHPTSNKFDFNFFKKIKTYFGKYAYALKTLRAISRGTSRATFLLPNGQYVLKMVYPKEIASRKTEKFIIPVEIGGNYGFAQNKEEVEAYKNCKELRDLGFLAEIKERAPDYSWIIMEAVEPLELNGKQNTQAIQIFEQHAKMPFDKFETVFENTMSFLKNHKNLSEKEFENELYKIAQNNEFIIKLALAAYKCNLMPGDIARHDSWGISKKNNMPKLLDYGLTKTSHEQYKEERFFDNPQNIEELEEYLKNFYIEKMLPLLNSKRKIDKNNFNQYWNVFSFSAQSAGLDPNEIARKAIQSIFSTTTAIPTVDRNTSTAIGKKAPVPSPTVTASPTTRNLRLATTKK